MMVESSMVEDILTAHPDGLNGYPKIIDTVSVQFHSNEKSRNRKCDLNIRVISEILRFK